MWHIREAKCEVLSSNEPPKLLRVVVAALKAREIALIEELLWDFVCNYLHATVALYARLCRIIAHSAVVSFGSINANKPRVPVLSIVATRRKMPRFDMALPLEVSVSNSSKMEGTTRDLSARGVYFYLDRESLYDRTVEFTVVFPKEVTGLTNLAVRCVGNVLRVEATGQGKIGVAAEIQRYEFLSSSEA